MTKSVNQILCLVFFAACLILPDTCRGVTNPCPPFYLRTDTGDIINPISGENADQPFSTRKTCGACHDVDTISKGYHFNMDWDKADDDRFKDTPTPWKVSTGLTGSLITYGFFQLAKKENTHPHEIDLGVFDFVARVPQAFNGYQKPGCAACHPGGGMLEFDRDGLRYDRRLAENPGLAHTLDGDYYQSRWDKTGVIEPDCFFCHADRYHIQTRILQIKNLNFKWAGTAAAGIGRVYGSVSEGGVPRVVYNRRLFNEDGTFYMPDMVFKPRAENCLICHATIELGKRGNSWGDPVNPDVHHLAGLTCTDCHFGDISHNFAKGNAMDGTVADDLDNTMRSCRDCHTTGYKGATRMKHWKIRKDHLDKLSCEACHIPELNRSPVGAMYLNTGVFGKQGRVGTKGFGEHKPWKPAYVIRKKDRDQKPRITPVNPMVNTLFTNRDVNGTYVPLFLSEVALAYEACQEQMSPRSKPYDFHDPTNIRIMLETLAQSLRENRRFKIIAPHFHTAGTLYSLDKSQSQSLDRQVDTTWVSRLPYFSISHNVAYADKALGAGGCTDCHADDTHIFNGLVVTDYFADNGRPQTLSMARFLDLPLWVQPWNSLFGVYLKAALPIFLAGAGVLVLIIAFRIFSSGRVPANASGIRTGILAIVLMTAFCAGHLLMNRDMGVLGSVHGAIMEGASFLGPFLMLLSIVFGFFLIRKKINNKRLSAWLLFLCLLTVITGLISWIPAFTAIDVTFIVSTVHNILAFITAGVLVVLVLIGQKL